MQYYTSIWVGSSAVPTTNDDLPTQLRRFWSASIFWKVTLALMFLLNPAKFVRTVFSALNATALWLY